MVQGGCGLIDQEVWLSSFPYTGTKKMAAVVRDLGRHSLEPPCLHIAAGYSLMLKVTEQGASPAGLGSAPCTQPPELGQGVLQGTRLLLEGPVATGAKAQLSAWGDRHT